MSEITSKNALVIGHGGIAQALLKKLRQDGYHQIHCVSRQAILNSDDGVSYHQLPGYSEPQISAWCQGHKLSFTLVICCTGFLHQNNVQPEKKLEDINHDTMMTYFEANTLVPALWLKYGLGLFERKLGGRFVLLSARVGSIEDNQLGGWYGYRASKAALNMLIQTAQVEYARRSPRVALVAYHPGTVDTGLSKPFQRRVPEGKLFSPEQAANYLLSAIDGVEATGRANYLDWRGKTIPW